MLLALPLILAIRAAVPNDPAEDHATLVETVRILAGHQLYQTYRNLDTATELRFFGVREAGELTQILRSCIESATDAEEQLARVAKIKGLSREDAAAVAKMQKIAKLLVEQGNALRSYWETGVEDHWKDSETARKAAWKDLADILDLEGKKGIAPKPREAGKKE